MHHANLSSSQFFSNSSKVDLLSEQGEHLSHINEELNKILRETEQMIKKEEEVGEGVEKLELMIEKIEFLKTNKIEYDERIEFICYYNISCGYQTFIFSKIEHAIDKCLRYIQKSLQLLKNIILHQTQFFFQFTLLLLKIQLQYCAILSQADNHRKALDVAIQTNDEIISLFKAGLKECEQMSQEEGKRGEEIIEFSDFVLRKATDYLRGLIKIENYSSIMETDYEEFRKIKENNYFWKDNYENNEKTFRKQLPSSNCFGRNVLGLKIKNTWIEHFTISKIMHLKPLVYADLLQPDNILFQFSYQNIMEKIILVSATYFSIATEMRFIEREKEKEPMGKVLLKKSEIFHLKSIQIICKNIKESSLFVSHLINSYQRHYSWALNPIHEEPSFAEYSLIQCRSHECNSCQKEQGQIRKNSIEKGTLLLFKKKKGNNAKVRFQNCKFLCIEKPLRNGNDSGKEGIKKQKMKLEKSTSISHLQSNRNGLKKSLSLKGNSLKKSSKIESVTKFKKKLRTTTKKQRIYY